MSLFIRVHVDDELFESDDQRRYLVELCPVDIFAYADGRIEIQTGQQDECTLCGRCWQEMPPGSVAVERLYVPAPGD